VSDWVSFAAALHTPATPRRPVQVSVRTVRAAIDTALMHPTRHELEIILADELKLPWTHRAPPSETRTKRELIGDYTPGWSLLQLIGLGRRIVTELDLEHSTADLRALLQEHDRRGGGVDSPAKNLIFAANGPKPELVLRDAVSNQVEITKNGQYCLVFDQPISADGLTFQRLIEWWRDREGLHGLDDRAVGLQLHARLNESIAGNPAESVIFDVYTRRYKDGFGIPALIPQVYLHYDPYTRAARGTEGSPLDRQRMDFFLLFSDRQRVVIEVDGRQHYADEQGRADTALYAKMVAEDRRLRLSGYEVYRFGGHELLQPGAAEMVSTFFNDLHQRMT
jgi:very-short-patch-repair endonuclease